MEILKVYVNVCGKAVEVEFSLATDPVEVFNAALKQD